MCAQHKHIKPGKSGFFRVFLADSPLILNIFLIPIQNLDLKFDSYPSNIESILNVLYALSVKPS